ncbi:hypothetical protein pb186bvf_007559 [Paramecium bursaria]
MQLFNNIGDALIQKTLNAKLQKAYTSEQRILEIQNILDVEVKKYKSLEKQEKFLIFVLNFGHPLKVRGNENELNLLLERTLISLIQNLNLQNKSADLYYETLQYLNPNSYTYIAWKVLHLIAQHSQAILQNNRQKQIKLKNEIVRLLRSEPTKSYIIEKNSIEYIDSQKYEWLTNKTKFQIIFSSFKRLWSIIFTKRRIPLYMMLIIMGASWFCK